MDETQKDKTFAQVCREPFYRLAVYAAQSNLMQMNDLSGNGLG
ncbi:hypothetical protein [Dyadobacter diqingensis]|nr:hypothetical protein [Dyadobacter diqingensis]